MSTNVLAVSFLLGFGALVALFIIGWPL